MLLLIIKPDLFTLLSAEHKDEPLLDFAGVWYAKTQLPYMHPLHFIWFLPHAHFYFSLKGLAAYAYE